MLSQAIWSRREQAKVFATAINVLASGLSLNPQVSTKIESCMDDFINIVMPGAKEAKKKADENFIKKTASALDDVARLLQKHNSKISTFKKTGR